MENKLKQLFDYQRFENNPRLAKLINETESSTAKMMELNEEDLFLVSAAGEFGNEDPNRKKR